MTNQPPKEPGVDPSVQSPAEQKKRAFAGKAFVIALGAFVVFGFCIYLFAGIWAGVSSN